MGREEYTIWHFHNDNITGGHHVFCNLKNTNAYNIGQIIEITNPKTFKQEIMKVTKKYETIDPETEKKVIIIHFKLNKSK